MLKAKTIMTGILLLSSAGVSYAATGAYLEPAATHSSYIHLVSDDREVVRDEASGTVARSSSGACIRTKWMTGNDTCATQVQVVPRTAQVVHQAASLSREERTIYFGFNQASISPDMRNRLDTLAGVLRSDNQVRGARIVGYADRIGNPGYNEKLSKKRAENVKQYLIAKGIINTTTADTRWLGSSTPSTDCPSDMKRSELIQCLQADRRVEVEIDFTPDAQASNQ